VRAALEAGVNIIDTAECYDTETHVGEGIKGYPREDLIIATKLAWWKEEGVKTPPEIEKSIEASLRNLGTDVIDIYFIHGIGLDRYAWARETVLPPLERAREAGKIKHIGLTEGFNSDRDHRALAEAVKDDCWDVFMVGFNIMNTSARESVLKPAMEKDIGILNMFAVRQALVDEEGLRQALRHFLQNGELDAAKVDLEKPLGFLTEGGAAVSIREAAYRFCRHEPGIHVVLSGTGDPAHFKENVESIQKPPLPDDVLSKLEDIFGGLTCMSGELD